VFVTFGMGLFIIMETGDILWSFADFWNAYGKKVGKYEAYKQWEKLSSEDISVLSEHVPKYVSSRKKQYRKDPVRYLKHRNFEDEIITYTNERQQATHDQRKNDLLSNLYNEFTNP
jgi:hypothetical protein